ncbi:MAG TPA: IPT/TIG domain-containing protein, partial [Bryobacteraceae bacterium]|nr:IPT/TIG domain-containing protein [Bryobacteraceae bacterium]
FNIGSGTLSLQATSSVTWLVPTVGSVTTCGLRGGCYPIQIALQTSALAAGSYTGKVTIADSGALDAPQMISVTVNVGGDVPGTVTFYLADSGTTSRSFTTGSTVTAKVGSGTPWLTATTATSQGLTTVTISATASSSMAASAYNGTVTISGSSFAADNKAVSVVLNVTTNPIVQLSSSSLSLTIPQNTNKESIPVAITNAGQGTLTVSSVTAAAASSGTWLSAATISGGMTVTADPTGLAPGVYSGTVTVASNAANSSVVLPVQLTVEAQGPPFAFAGGVVNNGTFANGEPVAQGDIAAVFGDQFTYDAPQGASGLPLLNKLDNIQVLVNGVAAPIFFTSSGQINFEVPIDAATGNGGGGTVQVVRNGQAGNMIYVDINARAPRFILFGGFGPYAVMTTPGGTLTGIPSHPAKVGDTLVIYAVGLGPTSPSVANGAASPPSPNLAEVPGTTQVCFGVETPFEQAPCGTAGFTGLTPGYVGLYQINVNVPSGVKSGNTQMSLLLVDNTESDIVQIAIQ